MNFTEAKVLYVYDGKELKKTLEVLSNNGRHITCRDVDTLEGKILTVINQKKEKVHIESKVSGKDYTIQTYMEKPDDI